MTHTIGVELDDTGRVHSKDLTRTKFRPVLLIADAGQNDWICCQITSNPYIDPLAIPRVRPNFISGGLNHLSYIRPGKLFTANESLIAADSGAVKPEVLHRVRKALLAIVR